MCIVYPWNSAKFLASPFQIFTSAVPNVPVVTEMERVELAVGMHDCAPTCNMISCIYDYHVNLYIYIVVVSQFFLYFLPVCSILSRFWG